MGKFDVGTRVYTICNLDPKRMGVVKSITPTGRINVEFSNELGGSFTVQFTKNGTYGKGYFITYLEVLTPEIEEEIKQQDVVFKAQRLLKLMGKNLSFEEALKIIEIYESRGQHEN